MKSIAVFAAVAVVSSVAFAEEATPIEISVSKEGVVALAGQPLTVEELAKHLAMIAKKGIQPEVTITSAEDAPLKVCTAVMDACRQNGINKIRLRTR